MIETKSQLFSIGLYIHIPFCKVKCMYCDFYSVADRSDSIPSFFNALFKEIEKYEINSDLSSIDTIFIGGGTPSLTSPILIEKLIQKLNDKFNLSSVFEFTIEANPGEAPLESLKLFREMGINRLSMGAQSLNPDLLKFLTRAHGPKEVFKTFENARKANFENINCDLIFNIPGQTFNIWKNDLKKIIDLDPEHISCYSLTVENDTQLYQFVRKGKVTMPTDDHSSKLYQWTQAELSKNNFNQYEVSNWSKHNKKCYHNMHYWEIDPYISFGPSAHGFDGKKRYANIRNLDGYIKSEGNKSKLRDFVEIFSSKNYANELIGFGLRIDKGVPINKLPKKYKSQFIKSVKKFELKWGEYFIFSEDSLKLSGQGLSFADAIAIDLMID